MALVIIIASAIPRLWGVNIVSPRYGFFDRQCFASLLAANSRNEQLQESVGVDVDADLRVGLDLIDSLDHVTVAMQHVALDHVVAIGHRLAAREVAARFNVDVHRWSFYERGVDRYPDGQRIIHRRATETELR